MSDAPSNITKGEHSISGNELTEQGDVPTHYSMSEEEKEFLEVLHDKNHADKLKELGLTPGRFRLLLRAIPYLEDSATNTTSDLDPATEPYWVSSDESDQMTEQILKRQELIGKIKPKVPRVVVTDIDGSSHVLEEDETGDYSFIGEQYRRFYRALLMHPYARRGLGKSVWFFDRTDKAWEEVVDDEGDVNFLCLTNSLYPYAKDDHRVHLMKHGQEDEWLLENEEDVLDLAAIRDEGSDQAEDQEEHESHSSEDERPAESERNITESTPQEPDMRRKCQLSTVEGEIDPFAWNQMEHQFCPDNCNCSEMFHDYETNYESLQRNPAGLHEICQSLEILSKVPAAAFLQLQGRDVPNEVLPTDWLAVDPKTTLDIIRAIPRYDRSLLMNLYLRYQEYSTACKGSSEDYLTYSRRYCTQVQTTLRKVSGCQIFLTVLQREIHLEMVNYGLTWAQVKRLVEGEWYDHAARSRRAGEDLQAIQDAMFDNLERFCVERFPIAEGDTMDTDDDTVQTWLDDTTDRGGPTCALTATDTRAIRDLPEIGSEEAETLARRNATLNMPEQITSRVNLVESMWPDNARPRVPAREMVVEEPSESDVDEEAVDPAVPEGQRLALRDAANGTQPEFWSVFRPINYREDEMDAASALMDMASGDSSSRMLDYEQLTTASNLVEMTHQGTAEDESASSYEVLPLRTKRRRVHFEEEDESDKTEEADDEAEDRPSKRQRRA